MGRFLPLAVVLPFYALLTGLPGSVVRAVGLALLGLAAPTAGARARPLRILGLLFWAGCVWEPRQVLDTGLQLSYLAAGGILAVSALTDGFRFAEGLGLFKDRFRTIPEAAPGLKAVAQDGLAWLDGQIAGRDTIVPGRFTLADVTLYAFLEFGGTVGQTLDPALKNLAGWLEKTKARPSAEA